MLHTAIAQALLIRLACFGSVTGFVAGVLQLAGRYLELDSIPSRVMRKVEWWHAHGRAVLLGSFALAIVSAMALLGSRR